MLLQTNSYIVPKEKRAEHSRVLRRFRQTLLRLGCDHFEVYEQVGANWANADGGGRYVQILRFNDRKHQQAVQAAERTDATAQAVIAEFCELINFPYQQQQGLFAVGFYTSALPPVQRRGALGESTATDDQEIIEETDAPLVVDQPVIPETSEHITAAEVDTQPDAAPAPESHPVENRSSSDDEFEDLLVDELEDSDESGGFLADDDLEIQPPMNGKKPVNDDAAGNSTHPAHAHKAKNRPMGW